MEDVDKVDVGVCCATDWREVDKSGWGKGKTGENREGKGKSSSVPSEVGRRLSTSIGSKEVAVGGGGGSGGGGR